MQLDQKRWHVGLIKPEDKLYQWIKKLSLFLPNSETLFIIDDIIADKSLAKQGQSPLKLITSGRHCNYYLWLFTQSYSAMLENLRRQNIKPYLFDILNTTPKTIFPKTWKIMKSSKTPSKYYLPINFLDQKRLFPISEKLLKQKLFCTH